MTSDTIDRLTAEIEALRSERDVALADRDKAEIGMARWFETHIAHRTALDALGKANGHMFKRAREAEARAESAGALLAKALEGLRPFADAIGHEKSDPDDARRDDRFEIWEMAEAMNITLGHLRTARALVEEIEGRAK